MIIDSHVHLLAEDWIDRSYHLGIARVTSAQRGKVSGEYPDPEALVDRLMPKITDTTGEKTVSDMDEAGVDMSCIFSVDFGLLTGEPPVSIQDQNRMIAEAARRFPDRLIPFFAIDPRRPGGMDLFQRGVEEWGMKGLKLHPASGFYPYDPVVYPFYEKCLDYGIPVLFHTGSQPAPMKFRFAQPINLDDVAADFPQLPIIMAHCAHSLWEEALLVAEIKPNVYFDLSGWQLVCRNHPERFYRMLRALIDQVGPWRVFFGTDGPFFNVFYPWGNWVKAIIEPDLSSCPEVSFTAEEKEIVMGKAFARLIGLE